MTSAPRVLVAFCGQGGSSQGWADAGYEVEGVDNNAACGKRYPFEFHHGDALDYIAQHFHRFDVIHASPPCQHASAGTRALRKNGKSYPRLIAPTRDALQWTGLPYVIENVKGSALRSPLVLCGTMFGLTAVDDDGTPLEMWRHRHFESNVLISAPRPCRHHAYSLQVAGCYGGARRDKDEARHVRHGGYVPAKHVQEELMGVDWMTETALHQAVPPRFTRHIALQMLDHLKR